MGNPNGYPRRPFIDGEIFTTNAGVDYFLLFQLEGTRLFGDVPDLANHIFSIHFFPLDVSRERHLSADERIIQTVIAAIREKFVDERSAVFYIVDDSDGREAVRGRYFRRLFESWRGEDQIEIISGSLSKEYKEVVSALLIHENNPKKDAVVARFFDLLKELSKAV